MARKSSKTPIHDPPTASSSEEDEQEEETSTQFQKNSTLDVKPKATDGTSKAKTPRSKPLPSSTKRPSVSEHEPKESKRSKKISGDGSGSAVVVTEVVKKTGEDEKKQLFQRIFSDDDEIAVLKGLLDYLTEKGVDPSADANAFHDFVKDSIHTDVSKAQLMYKVRRLRKKFENNTRRSKKGEDRVFSNPHEQKSFELSKKIWGKEGIIGKFESSAKGNGKEVDFEEPMEVEMELSKSLGTLFDMKTGVGNLENEILEHGFDAVGEEKRANLEEKWRKFRVAELELFVQRKELIIEKAKLLLESYKSEDA